MASSVSLANRAIYDVVLLWKSGKNSIREYSAITSARLHTSLIVVQALLLAHVGIAMTQPPNMNTTAQNISGGILITLALVLTVIAFETDRRKRMLIHMIEQQESK